MTERSQPPAQVRPLRKASPSRRALALLIGPILWIAALVVLAFVLDQRDAVEVALIVLAASFAAGLLFSGWLRAARVREERDA